MSAVEMIMTFHVCCGKVQYQYIFPNIPKYFNKLLRFYTVSFVNLNTRHHAHQIYIVQLAARAGESRINVFSESRDGKNQL